MAKTCTVTQVLNKKGEVIKWRVLCSKCGWKVFSGNWTIAATRGYKHKCSDKQTTRRK